MSLAKASLLLCMVCGWLHASAGNLFFVYRTNGEIEAFDSESFATPEMLPDGALRVACHKGPSVSFPQGEYLKWDEEVPSLPFFTSFKFNNKFNAALHQDAVAEGLSDSIPGSSLAEDTLRFTLNAIGKSLTPSFKMSEPEAVAYIEGEVAESKVSRFRFDHDIVFTVCRPGCRQWTLDDKGKLCSVPFGHTYRVCVDWLTDNPMNVPRIDINIEGGQTVTSKVEYLKATFSIAGHGVYDDFPAHDVWIKGRGNTSWGWPKKPYRLRFDDKVKPFGLTAGRSWVLLSNYQKGSLFANALAIKSGQLAEVAGCNHIVPVELYVNKTYQGSYMFTEKVGFGNNSLDGDETTDCLLELSREFDEPYRFRSEPYLLPVNIKEPDMSEWASTTRNKRIELIQDDFNRLAQAIARQSDEVGELLDLDACARFLLVNDLNNNVEINHPKSTFLFKEDIEGEGSKYVFGPIWDFDWSYGFSRTNTYFDTDQQSDWLRPLDGSVGDLFFGDLMGLGMVKRQYYKVWMDYLNEGCIDELKAFVQDYYDFVRLSFEHDIERWGQTVSYSDLVKKAQRWLDVRADYIVGGLTTYDLTDFDQRLAGDVNGDGALSVTDAVLTFNYLQTGFASGMDLSLADVNYDGCIDVGDIVCIVRRILRKDDSQASALPYGYHTLTAQLVAAPFEAEVGERQDIAVQIVCDSTETDRYCALQCDICLPRGLRLTDVQSACAAAGYSLTYSAEEAYARVVLMPANGDAQPLQDFPTVLTLSVTAEQAIDPDDCRFGLTGIRLTSDEGDEEHLHPVTVTFTETTGMDTPQSASLQVTGGHCITIIALTRQQVDVLSADGKCLTTWSVSPGRNTLQLPKGVYVIAGKKAIVY